jgi:hypothetical protein
MPVLPTGGNVRYFRALHLVSQPPPELSHGKPKGLVSVGLRRACHHHTLLDQVFVNSDLHCTIPFVRTCRRYEQWSTAEVRSGNGGMRAKWTQRTPTKRRTAMHAPSRPVADGRDGRERVTFTLRALEANNNKYCNGKWRAFWTPITKSAHTAVSPWSA